MLTLFTSSLYFAALVSTSPASVVTGNKERRISTSADESASSSSQSLTPPPSTFSCSIIGRVLLDVGIGFSNQAVPLYLSKMAPSKIRGAVNQLFQLTTYLGILIANLINYGTEKIHPWGWWISLGSAAVPAVLMFIGGVFMPESPNSLVEQGREKEAKEVLERVRGTKNVEVKFLGMKKASKEAQSLKNPFRNLLKRKNRSQLVIGAIGIPMFQQLTGNNSILFYATVFFQTMGFVSGSSILSSLITNAGFVVGALMSMAVVDKLGRRFLFIEVGIEMFCYMVMTMATTSVVTQGAELCKEGERVLVCNGH